MGEGITLFEPQKKPRGGELTPEEKRRNQTISRTRVVVEQVISGVKRISLYISLGTYINQ